jgi:tetratricopeptide (TPR) repeat protein
MSRESVPAQIGKAWQSQHEGRNAEAIAEFNRILKEAPESVDAYYGLGLAQRADGQQEAAIKSFQKALALAKEAASKYGVAQEEIETQNREDNLLRNSGQDDRYMMLRRMIRQRLAELIAVPQE